MEEDDLLGIGQAAKMLGLHHSTVRHWINSGRLPAERRGTKRMVSRSELEKMLKDNPSLGHPRGAPRHAGRDWAQEPDKAHLDLTESTEVLGR